jgi:hypothetical protein
MLFDNQFKKHPLYNDTTNQNDIALMKLITKVPFSSKLRPVCLPQGRRVQRGDYGVREILYFKNY